MSKILEAAQYGDAKGTIIRDFNRDVLVAAGNTPPANGTSGYAVGATFYDLNATSAPFTWKNRGSRTSSKWVPDGGIAYTNTAASTAVHDSNTEALFDTSYSIPANTLWAGAHIHFWFQGIATATVGADTLTIKAYIGGTGGTALLTGTATNVADNDIFAGECHIHIRTIGATGTFVAFGYHTDVPAASGTATIGISEITASTTIDTTAAQVVGVSATWSTTNANSCRLDVFGLKIE